MTSELRPEVEVASAVYDECREKGIRDGGALIKADREAVRAEQDAEIERLRKALEAISNMYPDWASERMALVRKRAKSALGEK